MQHLYFYLTKTDIAERRKLPPTSNARPAVTTGGEVSMVTEPDIARADRPTKSVAGWEKQWVF